MDKIFQREKYNYDMSMYVELPNYNDFVIEIDLVPLSAVENELGNSNKDANEMENEFAEIMARREFHKFIKENAKFISYPEKEYEEKKSEIAELSDSFYKQYDMSFEDYVESQLNTTLPEYNIREMMEDEMLLVAIADKEGIVITENMVEKEKQNFISYVTELYTTEHNMSEEDAKIEAQIEFEKQGGLYYAYETALVDKITKEIIKYNKKST